SGEVPFPAGDALGGAGEGLAGAASCRAVGKSAVISMDRREGYRRRRAKLSLHFGGLLHRTLQPFWQLVQEPHAGKFVAVQHHVSHQCDAGLPDDPLVGGNVAIGSPNCSLGDDVEQVRVADHAASPVVCSCASRSRLIRNQLARLRRSAAASSSMRFASSGEARKASHCGFVGFSASMCESPSTRIERIMLILRITQLYRYSPRISTGWFAFCNKREYFRFKHGSLVKWPLVLQSRLSAATSSANTTSKSLFAAPKARESRSAASRSIRTARFGS